jgi:predicted MFS family arabinose efflux permease
VSTTSSIEETPADGGNIEAHAQKARWGAVWAMTACAFALVASEFMPVSLLTPISRSLQVSEGAAGQGIAISGALAVLTSLTISRVAGRLDRKMLLIALTLLMALSGATIAFASTYPVYMIGRAMIGVVVGGFWSLSAATAVRLVPEKQVPRALAIFNGGSALASVLGAPLGSYLGSLVGWQGAFLCLVPVAAIAAAALGILLPRMSAPARVRGSGNIFGALRHARISLGLAACGALFMGQFLSFTFVRPFLEGVSNANSLMVSVILLVIGAAGLIGTALIGRFLESGMYRTLTVIPLLMAGTALALIPLGASLGAVVVLYAVWGLLSTSAPVGWWSWIARAMPDDVESGGGLMVAVIQLCIALGSTLGGILYDGIGYRGTFISSAVVLVIGAVLATVTARVSATNGR